MLFNSLAFLFFLPIVFVIYWQISKIGVRIQNLFLVVASYIFYGWWDWRFLGLIIFSSAVDYLIAKRISETENDKRRKFLLAISLSCNLGILGFFKYFNFFSDNLDHLFSMLGFQLDTFTLNVILPVGISFYTFQTLSYTIDVYRKDIRPVDDLISFFCYVSFFPQLVAGPIERSKNLLPQITTSRSFDYYQAVDGCRQILWGFFKKVVIADNCAYFLDPIFSNSNDYDSFSLVIAAFLFSFQIYGDFSGYSDIAIGTAKLFGIKLQQNFSFPYFSRDIAEFWRRWHISLSSWFKDYLYIPLGGSKGSTTKVIRNVFIIFIISGFWHGANWTFIVWGFLNALYFLPSFMLNRNRSHLGHIIGLPSFLQLIQIISTFILTTVAWVFFRSSDLGSAWAYLGNIFNPIGIHSILETPVIHYGPRHLSILAVYIAFMILMEWKNRMAIHGLFSISNHKIIRITLYLIVAHCVVKDFYSEQPFIYFQF